MRYSSSTVIVQVFLAATIPVHASAYKILMIPALIGKSHVFQLAAVSKSLIDKGHQIIFFVGESYPLNLPELQNRSEFRVIRYRDTAKEAHMNYNYDAVEDNFTRSALEPSGDIYRTLSTLWNMYANWLFFVAVWLSLVDNVFWSHQRS